MDRYEVYPVEADDGYEWSWRRSDEDGKELRASEDSFASRGDAIAAARADRGDGDEELFRSDGSSAGKVSNRGPESLVLMRPDGSVYGEIDHAIVGDSAASPQVITIEPAEVSDSAEKED